MSKLTAPTYKTTNWTAYNEALKRRRPLTIWFDPEMTWDATPSGKRGRSRTFSDTAIQKCLTMKVLFAMALRQTGQDWKVLDFSTIYRRQKTLAVEIPYRASKGPLHLLIANATMLSQTAERLQSSPRTETPSHGMPFGAKAILCGTDEGIDVNS